MVSHYPTICNISAVLENKATDPTGYKLSASPLIDYSNKLRDASGSLVCYTSCKYIFNPKQIDTTIDCCI